MRRRLLSHLTYANVMVTILAFIVLGGGTALAAYIVSSNSQIGPGTVSGHKPPTGKHANIIAGSINGQDVAADSLTGANVNEQTLTGNVKKLIYDDSPSGTRKTIATVGPYKLKGRCSNPVSGPGVQFVLYANGPAGGANLMYSGTDDETTDLGNGSGGFTMKANSDNVLLVAAQGPTHFQRLAGTAMLQSGSSLIQVYFNAVADARGSGDCFLRGTATIAT